MPRVHLIHAAGSASLSSQCATPVKFNEVVGNRSVPKQFVPAYLPQRYMGRNASKLGAMASVCESIRVYGCNVNQVKAGTTGGEWKRIA